LTLFDEVGDLPTPAREVDPGGVPLPPVTRVLPAAPAIHTVGVTAEETVEVRDFVPGLEVRPRSGKKARARANLEAIVALGQVQMQDRAATGEEQEVLARWLGWGAVPKIFEIHRQEWDAERRELHNLLSEKQWQQAPAQHPPTTRRPQNRSRRHPAHRPRYEIDTGLGQQPDPDYGPLKPQLNLGSLQSASKGSPQR